MISLRDIGKRYGNKSVLRDINLDVMPGEIFGLLGPNGAGKSTMLEILEGLRQPSTGSIDTSRPGGGNYRLGALLQRQDYPNGLSLQDIVRLFAALHGQTADVENHLELVGLSDSRDRRPGTLSGGQRQRFGIALALLNSPEILVLDEPTVALDVQSRREFWKLLAGLRSGRAVILSTHYLEEASAVCDKVAVLYQGRIVAYGTPAEVTELGSEPGLKSSSSTRTLEQAYLQILASAKAEVSL